MEVMRNLSGQRRKVAKSKFEIGEADAYYTPYRGEAQPAGLFISINFFNDSAFIVAISHVANLLLYFRPVAARTHECMAIRRTSCFLPASDLYVREFHIH